MKLGVCWIWSSPFVWSASVGSMLQLERPEGVDVQFFQGTGWCPATRHNNACKQALEWDADLILILGADQIYEQDLLIRLVGRYNEGYETVSALVPTRGFVNWQEMKPFQKMAWRFKDNEPGDFTTHQYLGMTDDADKTLLLEPNTGMQRANFIGSGVLMFHRDHLLALDTPWFYETIDPKSQQRIACMDTKFTWRLQSEAYAKLWVDTDIEVKHLHAFQIDGTYPDRFEDWATSGGDPSICRYLHTPESAVG